MSENENEGFLDLVEVGSREQFVQREVLHQLVILVGCEQIELTRSDAVVK